MGGAARGQEGLSQPTDLIDRLRLIRTPGIGPIAYRQLLLRFGGAEAALAAIPDLARRGGGKIPCVFARDKAAREIETIERLGARYLVWGQGLYPHVLAEQDDAPPLLTAKGNLALLDRRFLAGLLDSGLQLLYRRRQRACHRLRQVLHRARAVACGARQRSSDPCLR